MFQIPAEYKTVSEQVCVKPASCTYEEIPAVSETRTRKVCCTPATCTYETIPAVFKDESYTVCVKPACKRSIPVAPEFKTVEKQVCVCPARCEWRKTACSANKTGAVEIKNNAGAIVGSVFTKSTEEKAVEATFGKY